MKKKNKASPAPATIGVALDRLLALPQAVERLERKISALMSELRTRGVLASTTPVAPTAKRKKARHGTGSIRRLGDRWVIQWRERGQRHTRSYRDEITARQKLGEATAAVAAGRPSNIDKQSVGPSRTLDDGAIS